MTEHDFIEIIKSTLNSKYIGNDCAYLPDLGIVVTQDSLVEGVHFLQNKITPFQLGFKTAQVNISDICASGAEPKYLTVALSLPENTNESFIKDFYKGLKVGCKNVEIVGGDLTKADKIYISATAIGTTLGRNISSRSNAKIGQKIVISGVHGSSGAGLRLLLQGKNEPKTLIKSHLEPIAQREFSKHIATTQKNDYAMMDTSDGLADALIQISENSGVKLEIDFNKILYNPEIKLFSDWKDLILFGGEDYGIIATVDNPTKDMPIIGEVKKGSGVIVDDILLTRAFVQEKSFKHF